MQLRNTITIEISEDTIRYISNGQNGLKDLNSKITLTQDFTCDIKEKVVS